MVGIFCPKIADIQFRSAHASHGCNHENSASGLRKRLKLDAEICRAFAVYDIVSSALFRLDIDVESLDLSICIHCLVSSLSLCCDVRNDSLSACELDSDRNVSSLFRNFLCSLLNSLFRLSCLLCSSCLYFSDCLCDCFLYFCSLLSNSLLSNSLLSSLLQLFFWLP